MTVARLAAASPTRRAAAVLVALAGLTAAGCQTTEGSLDLSDAPAARTGADDGGAATVGADDDGAGIDALVVQDEPEPVRPEVVIPSEWPSEIEAVYGRYWLYWEAFAAAHGPPGADPTFAPLRELSTPGNWSSLESQLQAFADDGLVLDQPMPSITEHLLRLPSTELLSGDEGEEVVLQDCWIDDFVQRTIDGTVVAEANEAKLMNVVMKVVDGEWRVDGVTRAPQDSDGVEQCAELIN
ncbi:MAG: hypothetical protein AAGA93_03120 [Actinomycetota bacterium]